MLVKVKILNNIITIQSKFICHKFSRGSLSSSYSLCVNGSAMAPAHLIVVYRNFTVRLNFCTIQSKTQAIFAPSRAPPGYYCFPCIYYIGISLVHTNFARIGALVVLVI